jgi:poly(3-hydroxybutyrate) depolymerase
MGSSCSSADVLLGWRSRAGESAGTGAVVTDAGSGTMATAGWGGNAADAGMMGAAGKATQAGPSAGRSAVLPRAGMGAADGGAGAIAVAGAGGTASPIPGSPGCGADPPPPDTTIQVAGMSASYIVDLPPNYDKTRRYPLLMAFRGSDVTAQQFRGSLNLPQVAGTDAILVHPNCLGDALSWSVQRDTPLFDMLLAQTVARYCIDERRVFAAGQGIGGYFASMLGCLRADKLRAVAAFAPGVPPSGTCQGEVAVWIAQGKADTATAVANGRSTSDFWARRNGCDTTMSTAVDPSPCREFAGCHPGFAVRYCEYDGNLDLPPFAASGLWAFFKSL